MNTINHRKNIVRTILNGLEKESKLDLKVHNKNTPFITDEEDGFENDGDICIITQLYFPRKMSEELVTYSNYGPIWMGLWLDCPLYLHDGLCFVSLAKGGDFHGNTLFPAWLAEVLKEFNLEVHEDDIY
jgi:hypothetical protein